MQGPQKFTNFTSKVRAALGIAASAVILLSMLGDPQRLLQLGPTLLTISYLAYVVLWRPFVEVSGAQIIFRNVFQVIKVPWPAISEVSTQWSLTLICGDRKFSAWALPATATGRAPLLVQGPAKNSHANAVGALIRATQQEYSQAGFLSAPAARRLVATQETDTPTIAIAMVGVIVSVLALVLG